MPKYRIGSENGPETPNFKSVVDLRKWLITHYGNKKGTVGVYKYDNPKYGWIWWAEFSTTSDGWNWVGPNRASQWLTPSGNAKKLY